ASLAGASTIGAGSPDSTAPDPLRFDESNSRFDMSLTMLMKSACKTGAELDPRQPSFIIRRDRCYRLNRAAMQTADRRRIFPSTPRLQCFRIPAEAGIHPSAR